MIFSFRGRCCDWFKQFRAQGLLNICLLLRFVLFVVGEASSLCPWLIGKLRRVAALGDPIARKSERITF